jgi:hypothetical protein
MRSCTPNLLRDTQVSVSLGARLLLSLVVQKLSGYKFLWPEHVFILEHYFASELFAAICETLAMHILIREYQIMQQYTDKTRFWGM